MDEAVDRIDWARIRYARDRSPLAEASFVLSAIGVDHYIAREPDGWALLVPAASAQLADSELEKYLSENRRTPPQRREVVVVDRGWVGVIGYLLVIWMLPTLESLAFGLPWRDGGVMQASLVLAGQWWRTITALTLHADLGHLVANSLFGGVFGLLVGRHFGSGLGWLLIVLCGAAGNALDAAWQTEDFRSIGASTATFAAIGLVGSFVWRRGYYRTTGWRRSFAPIFAALALLAYTGFGGENTDIVAHVMGLATGLCCGLAVASFDIRRIGLIGQYCAGTAAFALVAFAWRLALYHGGLR
jgi:membrane associated rhomboid family serine protease